MKLVSTNSPIKDVKDLILRHGDSVDDLWQRWAMKVGPELALRELMKLATVPRREGDEIDTKVFLATYVEALVAEGVPTFAIGAAVGCFIRGHVPEQTKFFPSVAELLAECRRQFIAMVKIAPSFDGRSKDQPRGEWGGRGWEGLPQWMRKRIMDNRAAYEEARREDPSLTRVAFLKGLVTHACETASMRNSSSVELRLRRFDELAAIAAAARKRNEENQEARYECGIGI
jgi:hypothetical protein